MPAVTFQNNFRHSFHCCISKNSITKTDIVILMNFHHSMPDTVFYKHAKCQLPTMYIYYVNVFRYLANFQSPFSQNHLFTTLQGTFYLNLYNFVNNIGMEIIVASVESSLNCLSDDTIISQLNFPTYSSLW